MRTWRNGGGGKRSEQSHGTQARTAAPAHLPGALLIRYARQMAQGAGRHVLGWVRLHIASEVLDERRHCSGGAAVSITGQHNT